MAGSIKLLKRSLSAISIGQHHPKAAEIGTKKPRLNEDGRQTCLGARGSTGQKEPDADAEAEREHSDKGPEIVTPTPMQACPSPTKPSETKQSTASSLAHLVALSPVEPTRKEASLTDNPDSTPDIAAKQTSVTSTPSQSVGESGPLSALPTPIVLDPTLVVSTGEMRGAFANLWDDLAILVREMQQLSDSIEKGAEAGRLEKAEASGAQVVERSSAQKVRRTQLDADAINAQPAMSEVCEPPVTLVNLEAASPSVRENCEARCPSSKPAGLRKDSLKVNVSPEIEPEPSTQRFWKDEHIGLWITTSAIPSEKTRTRLLT